MVNADTLNNTTAEIDGKWVVARPVPHTSIRYRIVDAFLVLIGKCDAVKFYKQ